MVATTLKNANASLVYSFLYKTVEVGTGFSLAGWSVCLHPIRRCLLTISIKASSLFSHPDLNYRGMGSSLTPLLCDLQESLCFCVQARDRVLL